jgi:hypothetical protein
MGYKTFLRLYMNRSKHLKTKHILGDKITNKLQIELSLRVGV